MDKATLFVLAVLFEVQAQQDALCAKTAMFLNLNFGEVAEKAAVYTSSTNYNLADAKQFANDLLQDKIAKAHPRH
jgi:hypothetical protein